MEIVLHREGDFSTPSPVTGPHSPENIFKLISSLPSPVSLSFTTFIFVFPEEEALNRLTFSLQFFFSVYLSLGMKHEHGNVQTSAEPQKPQHLSGLEVRQKSSPLYLNACRKVSTCLRRFGNWLIFSNSTECYCNKFVQYLGYWERLGLHWESSCRWLN